jgi:ABC-type sugar transport system ATPase subunit
MTEVRLDGLRVAFGEVVAVDGVSLTISDGEFVVLLGPSGCGKTTTLRCIAGLERPTAGEIRFDGQAVGDLPPRERNVAMVFQFVSLYPHLSVRENIAFPLRARGERSAVIAPKIARMAKVFALDGILHRRPTALPPGARQKAALARAVVREPRVLLLDEPLSAIDEQFREEMRWELRHIQKELGMTTVHVTHDQREAMSLADRVVLMRDGRIVQAGPPSELFEDPADEFAAFFIGSPSVNLIDAELGDGVLLLGEERTPFAPPPAQLEALARRGLRRLRLGVRPHGVTPAAAGDAFAVPAGFVDARDVGRERHFDVRLGGASWKGVTAATQAADSAFVRLDPARLFYFAPDGARIRVA